MLATARFLVGKTGHEVSAVCVAKTNPEHGTSADDLEAFAISNEIPFLRADDAIEGELSRLAESSGADVCASINWPSLIEKEFIGLFRHGILNAHFGDLPRFRGNAVVNWAIILGEPECAFTIHAMTPGELDSGPILAKEKMAIDESTTIGNLLAAADKAVPRLFHQVLDGLEQQTLKPIPQENTGLAPMRCYPRLPRDGKIDWSGSAKSIHALVRGQSGPYPGAYTYFRDGDDELKKLIVWETRLVNEQTDDVGQPGHVIFNDQDSGESWVFTGSGVIALVRVEIEPNGEFQPGTVWKSIRMRLGMDPENEIWRIVTSQ